jgi:hypothetical protein
MGVGLTASPAHASTPTTVALDDWMSVEECRSAIQQALDEDGRDRVIVVGESRYQTTVLHLVIPAGTRV